MGVVVVKVGILVLELCVLVCFLVLPGSAGYNLSPSPSELPAFSPEGDATPTPVSNGTTFKSSAPTPVSPQNGTFLHPPKVSPPFYSAPAPQNAKGPVPSFPPIIVQPPNSSATPPVYSNHTIPVLPPSVSNAKPPNVELPVPEAPAPVVSLPRISPHNPTSSPSVMPGSSPPKSHENEPPELLVPPGSTAPAPKGLPPMVLPKISPSTLPAPFASSPSKLPENQPTIHPVLPEEPPSSLPEPTAPPVHSPPSTNPGGAPNRTIHHHSTMNPLPTKAPSPHGSTEHSDSGPTPLSSSGSHVRSESHSPSSQPPSPLRHHRGWNKKKSSAPSVYIVSPPPYTAQAPSRHARTDPKTNLKFHGPSPSKSGSSISPSLAPLPPSQNHDSPVPSQSQRMPLLPPKTSPSGSSQRIPKKPLPAAVHALPPPPPNEDCRSLTCSEPLTNGPPGFPCVCVFPIQVGLRLSVALYTFFPWVSELAKEIAIGVFFKPSQVRIMGANAATQDPEKTIVLIDLVPLGERFDNTTAYLTFQRFWLKQVLIEPSLFGGYEVLYVRYPGLPPSPPSAPSDIGIINSDPYSGRNGAAIKPLGVDVGRRHKKGGPSGSVIAIIVLSASVAVILLCAVAWVLFFKHRDNLCQQGSSPSATVPSLAKASVGIPASMMGSGPSSTSLSFHSSIAAYTGSAKTFSSSDIEKATDNFSETRILGEGGFGRVYSGELEDGTKVAVKVLKRADQQGGREFLAEVEMLSRLHHRNLVKLIGICTEDRARCLVYELIPNESVESHLHGVDKESSPLDWSARMKIALGAARGLAYLHEDSSPRVIHRDFKSSNILLEHDFTPKVSDFGLARTALEEENQHISTRVMGTFGYVAPEYAMTGHLLVKSDVYSYGVVLLELLTGRKPVDMSQPPGQENLVSLARPLLATEEGLESIIDPSLGPNFPIDSISKVAAIASMCVQPEVSHRPFMGEVVQALKLVCNECDETKKLGSRSCSRDDLSTDIDARTATTSGHLRDPLQGQSPVDSYNSEIDVERGYSASDLLAVYARQDSGSPRRHSSSGPLRIGKTRRLWQKMRQLTGGSVSEHALIYSSWRGSR